MTRVRCILAYDGSSFSGFQIQPNQRTVAGELEKALKTMHKGQAIRIQSAGRTDAGVHAEGQVIHFDTELAIPDANWKRALNALLPDDIFIKVAKTVTEGFHARFSAVAKEYRYDVQTTLEPDVFKREYAYYFPYDLNLEKVRLACSFFEGTHDFTTFSSAKATIKGSRVRTIYELSCKEYADGIRFTFYGNGFLYNMVRIIVSMLLDIGQGKREPEDIPVLLAARDRSQVGKTISPVGLYMYRVVYEK